MSPLNAVSEKNITASFVVVLDVLFVDEKTPQVTSSGEFNRVPK